MAVVIPSAGQVGNLYTIPQSDWIAINGRVAVVIEAQGIANLVSQYVPNYSRLLAACQQWKSQTLPGLVSQSVETSLFSNQAASILKKLETELQPLKPSDPLPDSIKFIFSVEFAALQQNAGNLSTASSKLSPQIATFVAENHAADAALEHVISSLGPGWEGVEGPIALLEQAMSDVANGWSAVQDAFGTAASSQADLTTAALLALDVGTAIKSWYAVAATAVAFDSHVTSQSSTV
jgi:hypothetical protein